MVTDTHLGHNKSSDKYLDVVTNLFIAICAYAGHNDITELIHLGDFFDNRKNISLKALDSAVFIGEMLQKNFQNTYITAGNHDLFFKDRYKPSSLQTFEKHSNIHTIYEPIVVGNIALVPWVIGDIVLPDARFCMGHFEMKGVFSNESNKVEEGVVPEAFKKYEKTLSGHFHSPNIYPPNIQYIGASYHMDFNDSGPRGFYVFDDESGELQFIEFTDYPKYVKWNVDPEALMFDVGIEGNIVKVIFNRDLGTTENNHIIKMVQEHKPYMMFTEYKFSKGQTQEAIAEEVALKGPKEIHRDYIVRSTLPEHLNAAMMVKMVDSLYEEMMK